METLAPRLWLERCLRRIGELDRDMAETDARRLARDLHGFERTRAMTPEAAVDFISAELASPGLERFERRLSHRT